MLTWIFLPIGIGIAAGLTIGAALLAIVLLWAVFKIVVVAPLNALRVRRECSTPQGRAQWLATARSDPRKAAMLEWIAAKRAGDKQAQALARARFRAV